MNTVDVVPTVGLIDAPQLGPPPSSTKTALDSHVLVPPGPVAVNVTAWLPANKVDAADPEHATLP